MGSHLRACLMQVQLLVPETQGDASITERLSPHAQQLVEPNGRVDVINRQNKVVERADTHAIKATRPRLVARAVAL